MKKHNPHKLPLPPTIALNLNRLRKEDERGLLYYLDYSANYYKLEKYLDMMVTPGCSTFTAKNSKGDRLFCRNYDFCHYRYNEKTKPEDMTGLIIVVNCRNRKAKYKSIGVVDGFWLDFAKGRFFEGALSDGTTDISRVAMAPFVIMDGANEAGLVTSIMHLPTENEWTEIEYREPESLSEKEKQLAVILEKPGEEPGRFDTSVKTGAIAINKVDRKSWSVNKNFSTRQQEPGKKESFHPVLMRKMLDFCCNVEEAIDLAKSVNVRSPLPDNDYHIMLSDRTGKTVILEWVNNKLEIIETTHGTNFYLARQDGYGYGQDRDEIVQKTLEEYAGVMSEEQGMALLDRVAQDIRIKKFNSFTQWSCVYNQNMNTLSLAVFMDFKKLFNYKIEG